MQFYCITLGCKINQYETEAVQQKWQQLGHIHVQTPEKAQCILVNSCAVTNKAVVELRRLVRSYSKNAPVAKIIITGCAAEIIPEELKELPHVIAVVEQSNKERLLDKHFLHSCLPEYFAEPNMQSAEIKENIAGNSAKNTVDATENTIKNTLENTEGHKAFPRFVVSTYTRSRPVIKIQDGCSHGCKFCIVPLTRGKAKSRPVTEILAEIRCLLEAGFSELILSGINLRLFSMQGAGKDSFWVLLKTIAQEFGAEWAGKARFRLSSLEPGQLNQHALDAFAQMQEYTLLAPHLHLSLQSGSPAVLERMGRGHYSPYGEAGFWQGLAQLWPVFGLGADILMGFPQETDAEFMETMQVVTDLPLTYAHVFPYSKRPGTVATAMTGQIATEVKTYRAAQVRALVQQKKEAFWQKLLAQKELTVAVEERKKTRMQGLCEYYVSCAFVPSVKDKQTEKSAGLVTVRPVGIQGKGLQVAPV